MPMRIPTLKEILSFIKNCSNEETVEEIRDAAEDRLSDIIDVEDVDDEEPKEKPE